MPAFEVLKSEKNRDVLLVDGFLFWFDRATPKGRKYWKCIYCYRGIDGDVANKCHSRVITSPGDINAIVCKEHNHFPDTILVEHMKAYGSIRRLGSAMRKQILSRQQSGDTPSTSLPIDLSLAAYSPSCGKIKRVNKKAHESILPSMIRHHHAFDDALPSKKSKKVLADVLEVLYNRIQVKKDDFSADGRNDATVAIEDKEKQALISNEKTMEKSISPMSSFGDHDANSNDSGLFTMPSTTSSLSPLTIPTTTVPEHLQQTLPKLLHLQQQQQQQQQIYQQIPLLSPSLQPQPQPLSAASNLIINSLMQSLVSDAQRKFIITLLQFSKQQQLNATVTTPASLPVIAPPQQQPLDAISAVSWQQAWQAAALSSMMASNGGQVNFEKRI